jgi:SulP family sulfate permease
MRVNRVQQASGALPFAAVAPAAARPGPGATHGASVRGRGRGPACIAATEQAINNDIIRSPMRPNLRKVLAGDAIAGAVTGVLLVPQALAYALLAGLPPQAGLYAAIVPALLYAGFGSSRPMSVGPTAVISLMTAEVLAPIAAGNSAIYAVCACALALFAGGLLLALGLFRLGVMVNFLSSPVLGGFTMGAALSILISQLPQLGGMHQAAGGNVPQQLLGFAASIHAFNPVAGLIAAASLAALLLAQGPLAGWLAAAGVPRVAALSVVRAMPLLIVIVSSLAVALAGLGAGGLPVVGEVQRGLPTLAWPPILQLPWRQLLGAGAAIGLVGYLEGISVARVLARRRRESVDANRELVALGVANIAAAFTQAMPVAGSFTRSVVNDAAGARTRLAGLFAALLAALIVSTLVTSLSQLPRAVLAAIIVVAVLRLMDFKAFLRVWRYDRNDGMAWVITAAGVVAAGAETGLVTGIVLSLLFLIWRTANPHVVEVGRVPHSGMYLDIDRYHEADVWPQLLLIRVDESLFFGNAAVVQNYVANKLAEREEVSDVILICSAVNSIDASAIEMLEDLDDSLRQAGVTLHLANINAPVMDRLEGSHLAERLGPGRMHISTDAAIMRLAAPPI